MQIYLVRHGQSQRQLRPSDDWDAPLTPVGREQAQCLARCLALDGTLDVDGLVEVAAYLFGDE